VTYPLTANVDRAKLSSDSRGVEHAHQTKNERQTACEGHVLPASDSSRVYAIAVAFTGFLLLRLGSASDIPSARVAAGDRFSRVRSEGECSVGLNTTELKAMPEGWDMPLGDRSQPTISGKRSMAHSARGERFDTMRRGYTVAVESVPLSRQGDTLLLARRLPVATNNRRQRQ